MERRGKGEGQYGPLPPDHVRTRKAGTSLVPPWPAVLTNLSKARGRASLQRSCFWKDRKKAGVMATAKPRAKGRPVEEGKEGSQDLGRLKPPGTAQAPPLGIGPAPTPQWPRLLPQGSHQPFRAPQPEQPAGLPPGDPGRHPHPRQPLAYGAPALHLRGALQVHLELRQLQGWSQSGPREGARSHCGSACSWLGGDRASGSRQTRGVGCSLRLQASGCKRGAGAVPGWVRQGPRCGDGRTGIQSRVMGTPLTVGSRATYRPHVQLRPGLRLSGQVEILHTRGG